MNETADRTKLEPSWKARIGDYLQREDMQALSAFLRERRANGARIFPPGPQIFAALDSTPFQSVKVVILGQDPYHGFGQAHGLCFSVPHGVQPPPSLINIFKELKSDLGIEPARHGFLERALMGSVSSGVAARAHCSVEVVRPALHEA